MIALLTGVFCALVIFIIALKELIRGYQTGVISGKGMDVKRSERPTFFGFSRRIIS